MFFKKKLSSIHPRSSPNSKHDKHRDIQAQTHYSKNSEREIFESSKRKITYHLEEIPITLTVHISRETKEARRQWDNIFKVLTEPNYQPRTFYSIKKKKKNF